MTFTGPERLLVPGKLRGYRAWMPKLQHLDVKSYWDAQDWDHIPWDHTSWGEYSYLTSVNDYRIKWPVTKIKARCLYASGKNRNNPHFDHPAPAIDCTCGVYGVYNPTNIFAHCRSPYAIYGCFDAWGKVILGESGFRAEYAKITAICGNNTQGSLLRHIAGLYKVPCYLGLRYLETEFPLQNINAILSEPKHESEHDIISRKCRCGLVSYQSQKEIESTMAVSCIVCRNCGYRMPLINRLPY